MNKKNSKMNTKRILVSFLLVASVLFLAGMVSAYSVTSNLALHTTVKVDGVAVLINVSDEDSGSITNPVSVNAGDTIEVRVEFTVTDLGTDDHASDVKVKVTLEGEKEDVTAVTPLFDVEEGKTYVKTLTLKVPSDFQDDLLSDDLTMNVKIWNSDYETEINDIQLRLQRPSYDVAIKSVMTSSTVEAGQLLPVDVVLKNVGYNDLEDVYVTAKITELGVQKTAYFGNLVTVAYTGDDEENTVSGRVYLEIPYNVKSGTYTLEVKAGNDETSTIVSKNIVVENGFPDLAMKSGNDLILLNPTNQLKVYTVKYLDKEVSVIVPAASSKSVTIETPTSGDYKFDVTVFSGDKLLSTVNFAGTAQPTVQLTSPIMILTIILAVVFFVLLIVLVVLITKKPQKTEEFGESYY
jgi:flagellar basal body-associated protein FliL